MSIFDEVFLSSAGCATFGKNFFDPKTLFKPANQGISVNAFTGLDKLKEGGYVVFHLWSFLREQALAFFWNGDVWFLERGIFTKYEKTEHLHTIIEEEKKHVFSVKFVQFGEKDNYEIVAVVDDITTNAELFEIQITDKWKTPVCGCDFALEFWHKDYPKQSIDWITFDGILKWYSAGSSEKVTEEDFCWVRNLNLMSTVEHKEAYEGEWLKKVELRVVEKG